MASAEKSFFLNCPIIVIIINITNTITISTINLVIILLVFQSIPSIECCALRKFNRDSYVCVCNEIYCDSLVEIEQPFKGYVHLYETSRDGLRFNRNSLKVLDEDPLAYNHIGSHSFPFPGSSTFFTGNYYGISITLQPAIKYQTLVGFGGAITDAAAINILSLSNRMGESVIRDFFGPDGLEYSLARIPIGATENSARDYSLAEIPSSSLDDFTLADEDIWFKIPVIQKARALRPDLKLVASPWSAPVWMTNLKRGRPNKAPLKGEPGGHYYKLWALYIVKFLEAYKSHGLNFWALTTGNKPLLSHIPHGPDGIPMTPSQQKEFIANDLGPLLNQSNFGRDKMKLFLLDDILYISPYWTSLVLEDPTTARYASGIAFHWYTNTIASRLILEHLHDQYPNQILLSTEASQGTGNREERVSLGNWRRAETYGVDIIEDFNHWTTGWIESSLALDMIGGPNKARRFQDAPIIVNAIHNEYYKQPTFYLLAHFTKFLGPGSYRIGNKLQSTAIGVHILTAINQDGLIVVVVLNTNEYPVEVRIEGFSGGYIWQNLAGKTIQTYIGQH